MGFKTDNTPETGMVNQALLTGQPAFLGFLAKRLGNLADAEDVLQEFCIRVLARKDQLRDVERINAWFYSILRSALNDFYRKSGRQERLGEAYASEHKDMGISSDAADMFAHICGCVRALLTELREADAALIRRIDLAEENRKSVAGELGLSTGALAVRLHRARLALRDELLGHCGYCCTHGFEDCSCGTAGCHNEVQGTDCGVDSPGS